MRTRTVVREAKVAGALAVAAAGRAVEAAAEEAAVEIQLNIEDLEDSFEEGRADIDRRLRNIETRDAARLAGQEKSGQSIAPGVQK